MHNGSQRIMRWLIVTLFVGPLAIGAVRAIDPADGLNAGQDLVDLATEGIDRQVARINNGPHDAKTTFDEVRGLINWWDEFRDREVASRYRLNGPDGLLIQDGVEDTLATRLHGVLANYVAQNPDEPLDLGREAVEASFGSVELPPGRLLGFHLIRLMRLYGTLADTILTRPGLDLPGVRDGFLRHSWDLSQVYDQLHGAANEKYFCQLSEEDWLASRLVCEKCGHQGVDYKNQMTGIREDTTAVCKEAMDFSRTDPEVILQRIDCRHWGHIFTAQCPSCSASFDFSVPLPYFKEMQRQLATGALKDVKLPSDRIIDE